MTPRLRSVVLLVVALACWQRRALADEGQPPKVVVLDAEALGVNSESATAVTRQLYATLARLGYRIVPEATARAATSSRPHPGARTPADLLDAAVTTHADHSISASLGALGDRYAVSVTVAHADRTGPDTKSAVTDPASLEAEVDGMTRSLLPPAPVAEPAARAEPNEPPQQAASAVHRLSLNTEGAFGLTSGVNENTSTSLPSFYNHMVGPRFDYGFPNDFAVGLFVGYANLKGKDGRANSVLSYLQLQYRTRVSKTSDFRIPLRLATGYLPKNGPFFRLAAGLDIPLGGGVHLGLDLIAPAIWMVRNRTLLSLDVGAEVGFDL